MKQIKLLSLFALIASILGTSCTGKAPLCDGENCVNVTISGKVYKMVDTDSVATPVAKMPVSVSWFRPYSVGRIQTLTTNRNGAFYAQINIDTSFFGDYLLVVDVTPASLGDTITLPDDTANYILKSSLPGYQKFFNHANVKRQALQNIEFILELSKVF